MTTALGIDWAADMAAEFGGELHDVTFTRTTAGAFDVNNPTRAPSSTTATYTAAGMAFEYAEEFIDGEKIHRGDYQVMLLLGTIEMLADDAVKAEIDLDALTIGVDTVLRARSAGVGGNLITLELVDDAIAQAGTIVEVGTNVRIGFLSGLTTVTDLEALIATSTLLEVKTAGTPSTLAAGDVFASTALAGGVDSTGTPAPSAIPQLSDAITCPPPNQTTPKTGIVQRIIAISEAAVTAHVRGPAL